MAKLTSPARYNLPVNTGVASNHSSLETSTSSSLPDHGQYDDALDNDLGNPNLSGSSDMKPLHDPFAGPLSGWEENDCYRDFLQSGGNAQSRIYGEDYDTDFDSNGGVPTPIPSYSSGFVPDREFVVSPVILRRF